MLSRRLHGLTCVVPLGIFLFFYYYLNTLALLPAGPQALSGAVGRFGQFPFLIPLELILVVGPLLVHFFCQFSVLYVTRLQSTFHINWLTCKHLLGWISGPLGLVFAFYFIYQTQGKALVMNAVPDYLWMVRLFEKPAFFLTGVLGLFFLTYYFFYSLWNLLIDWGIVARVATQRALFKLFLLFFLLLNIINLLIGANYFYHYQPAPQWIAAALKFVRWII